MAWHGIWRAQRTARVCGSKPEHDIVKGIIRHRMSVQVEPSTSNTGDLLSPIPPRVPTTTPLFCFPLSVSRFLLFFSLFARRMCSARRQRRAFYPFPVRTNLGVFFLPEPFSAENFYLVVPMCQSPAGVSVHLEKFTLRLITLSDVYGMTSVNRS